MRADVSRAIERSLFRLMRMRLLKPMRVDLEEEFLGEYLRCAPFTMTSIERMYALYSSVRYIVNCDVPGAIVECGVWRGGSMMLAAETLLALGHTDRQLYLYDTFKGMPQPTARDISYRGDSAERKWRSRQRKDVNEWSRASLGEVRRNVQRTGYPAERVQFVAGRVEETIPKEAPDRIGLLRLDTDWYESTYHELVHLFPRLEVGGVLIIDDYGHWRGAREAVDEYLLENDAPILLTRVDYTGRVGVKVR
jgi:O-methyltransferase